VGNVDPNEMFFIADRSSWGPGDKTIDGNILKLVAIQKSRRTRRKKRTIYVYHIANSNIIVYNRRANGFYFMRMALKPANIERYFEVFVKPPLTDAEKKWLKLYDYEIV